MLWSAGCIYAGRRSRRVERKRPVVAVLSRNQRLRHDRSTIRRRLEEAAGVEAQFEATQSTETPLEFLLRKMRDIRHRGVLSQLVVALSQLAERNGLGHYFPSNPLLSREPVSNLHRRSTYYALC